LHSTDSICKVGKKFCLSILKLWAEHIYSNGDVILGFCVWEEKALGFFLGEIFGH
jgi:hypothetical protein